MRKTAIRFVTGLCLALSLMADVSAEPAGSGHSPDYVLGSGDVINVWALELDEFTQKPIRIDASGFVNLPLAGRVEAAGLTVSQFENDLTEKLKKYKRNPQVTVTVTEFHSQPVSVFGAVNAPGVQHLEGNKTLIEVLSLAGGLKAEAGYSVKITRRREFGRIPLPNAFEDSSGLYSVASVSLKDITDAKTPEENILVKPQDVISVPRAQLVYVMGEVPKAGAYTLGESPKMSVLEAISLAGGMNRLASPRHARILRKVPDSNVRKEEEVDVNKVLKGSTGEPLMLNADDILYIPTNKPKAVTLRALDTAVNTGSGIIVWRGSR
jgi:polysaccharide export outer membrane protein